MDLLEEIAKLLVWQKGISVPWRDPQKWRLDDHDSWMRWSDYGKRQSDYGWEKAHIVPDVCGGQKELSNLRPLNWRNNLLEGSGGPLPWRSSLGQPASPDLDTLLRILSNWTPGTSKWSDSPPLPSPGWSSYLPDGGGGK